MKNGLHVQEHQLQRPLISVVASTSEGLGCNSLLSFRADLHSIQLFL